MPRQRERRWPVVVLGYAALCTIVLVLASVLYVAFDPSHRPLVVRLAVALIVGVVLLHLSNALRAACEDAPPSRFERALRGQRPQPRIDPHFERLCGDLRSGVASLRSFERVLWPRLLELADRLGDHGRASLAKPPGRLLGRGPSVDALEALIRQLEER